MKDDPTLALGSSEMNLLQLTAAYAALSDGKAPVRPYGLANAAEATRALAAPLKPAERFAMLDLLRAVVDRGTGRAARLSMPVFGKTGTAQDERDAVFVGFTGDTVIGRVDGQRRPLADEGRDRRRAARADLARLHRPSDPGRPDPPGRRPAASAAIRRRRDRRGDPPPVPAAEATFRRALIELSPPLETQSIPKQAMIMPRREFLKVSASAALLSGGPVACARRAATTQAPARAADHTLRIGSGLVELAPDQIVSTTTYNGGFPGPLLRFKEGRPVVVDVHNDTDTPEQLHWHGLRVPVDVDGAAEEGTPFIPAHGMRRVAFSPTQPGLRFYHTHVTAGADLEQGPLQRPGGAGLHRAEGRSRRLRP